MQHATLQLSPCVTCLCACIYNVFNRYVLPSGGGTSRFGSIRSSASPTSKDDQILSLSNERISVPELLFHPSDIGLRQMGVAEAIADIISKLDAPSAAACLRNIVCCGGTTSIPNFSQRLLQVLCCTRTPPLAHRTPAPTLAQDVRSMVPQAFEVNVVQMDNPASAACESRHVRMVALCVTCHCVTCHCVTCHCVTCHCAPPAPPSVCNGFFKGWAAQSWHTRPRCSR